MRLIRSLPKRGVLIEPVERDHVANGATFLLQDRVERSLAGNEASACFEPPVINRGLR